MTANNEKNQKVFVDQEGMATLECPFCSLKKSTHVDTQTIRKKHLRDNCIVRCTCQTKFEVTLEFRQDYRKPTNLTGEFISLPRGKERGSLTVVNVAKNGIGLEVIGENQFEVGDKILVLFNLDDNKATLIEKRAEIRFVKENYIGCVFMDNFPLGKALKSYLSDESKHDDPLKDKDVKSKDFDWEGHHLR